MSEGAITSAPASASASACPTRICDAGVVEDALALHHAVMAVEV
jgi:hypothetical protein